ncbi:dephospho-CoA kinase [Desulfohalovibrio reitneri]|uniref:dephospho-CoA kinase n=1 Tax=Desulfohalovibrio reitneri TaxID=1307759 RepID=UPI000550559F|nr:dephospho-CoA kinase [Desulfohalovibrio reitneri]
MVNEIEDTELLFMGEVPPEADGSRLDAFLGERLSGSGISRSRIQGFIRQGLALVDGRDPGKPRERLAAGQRVELYGPGEEGAVNPSSGELNILHSDEDVAVVIKPAGLTVHPAPGVEGETLVARLVHHFPGIASLDPSRPGIVHRLDKDTSGLMLVALNEEARLRLAGDFAARLVDKVYLCLVHGAPGEGSVDMPIGRDPSNPTRMTVAFSGGREARSDYRPLWVSEGGAFSLLAVKIHTGRTHQIRVHLSHLGHPLVGDPLYGPREAAELARTHPRVARLAARQMLHAAYISFRHPGDGERMAFFAPPPKDFTRLPLHMNRSAQRVGVVGLPGSGKSALCAIWRERGVPVFSADESVARQYLPGSDGWRLLRGRYGDRFVPEEDEPVDRAALFRAMMDEPALRREVEGMIHPLVRHDMDGFFREHADGRMAVAEIPLLFEAGWGGSMDAVVCVDAPDGERRRRLADRGVPPERVEGLDSWQWSREEKIAASSVVVSNSAGLDELDACAREALEDLRRLRAARVREFAGSLEPLFRGHGLPFLEEKGA